MARHTGVVRPGLRTGQRACAFGTVSAAVTSFRVHRPTGGHCFRKAETSVRIALDPILGASSNGKTLALQAGDPSSSLGASIAVVGQWQAAVLVRRIREFDSLRRQTQRAKDRSLASEAEPRRVRFPGAAFAFAGGFRHLGYELRLCEGSIPSEGVKRCAKCRRRKPVAAFTVNRSRPDGRQKACNACQRAYTRAHYWQNRATYIAKARRNNAIKYAVVGAFLAWLKEQPCADCGHCFHHVAMDFDHVHGRKVFNLADRNHTWKIECVMRELRKCEVVCSNCHRVRTFNRLHAKERTRLS